MSLPESKRPTPSRRVRATHLTAIAGLTALLFAGCATEPLAPAVPITGDALVDNNAQLAVARSKDKVLWEYRVAGVAIRRENWDEAKAKLDDAIGQAAANFGNVNSEAARSRGLFHNEAGKPFIGEPYERIMAYFYRGVIYWRDGEPDNARALFRTAQLIDSDTVDKTYAGDWVLLDYLDGFASAKLGGDGSDALARARANAKAQHLGNLPDYNPKANVLVFAEYGQGPRKYSGGEYGEELRFMTEQSRIVSATLDVDGRTVKMPPLENINYQATTRGGRQMDHILGNKAVFKQNANTVGDVALMGAVGTAQFGRGKDANNAALALGAVGLISKLASSATATSADVRSWDNIPQYLSFSALRLGPGDHPATLRFHDASGATIALLTQQFMISVPEENKSIGPGQNDVVIFRSAVAH